MVLPVSIPAGTRIAARQATNVSTTYSALVAVYGIE
jgi:hypothetical protein